MFDVFYIPIEDEIAVIGPSDRKGFLSISYVGILGNEVEVDVVSSEVQALIHDFGFTLIGKL